MLPRILATPSGKDAYGKLKSRIATVFPSGNTLVTLPGIHATQRLAYLDMLGRERAESGLGPADARRANGGVAKLGRFDRGGRHRC